jgi:hypothetical protein
MPDWIESALLVGRKRCWVAGGTGNDASPTLKLRSYGPGDTGVVGVPEEYADLG